MFRVLKLVLPQQQPRTTMTWTLENCLDKYAEKELLSDYRCEPCSTPDHPSYTMQRSSKINSSPEYLALQIVRTTWAESFDSSGRRTGYRSQKLMDTVSFPKTLDLAPWTTSSDPRPYELYSVIEHRGQT